MPDMALVRFVTDIGAWALSMLTLAWLWLHNRDDLRMHKRIEKLEANVESVEGQWADQRIANRLSAQADTTILTEISKLGERMEAISSRVDTIDRTSVELKTEIRHVINRTDARRERP